MENSRIPSKLIELILGFIFVMLIRKPLYRMCPALEVLERFQKAFFKVIGFIIIALFIALIIYSCFI
ncbi:MAG: hypothetical protein AB2L14_11840 [Candidatus Xenobiia bacterium LiM19]